MFLKAPLFWLLAHLKTSTTSTINSHSNYKNINQLTSNKSIPSHLQISRICCNDSDIWRSAWSVQAFRIFTILSTDIWTHTSAESYQKKGIWCGYFFIKKHHYGLEEYFIFIVIVSSIYYNIILNSIKMSEYFFMHIMLMVDY